MSYSCPGVAREWSPQAMENSKMHPTVYHLRVYAHIGLAKLGALSMWALAQRWLKCLLNFSVPQFAIHPFMSFS